MFEFFKRLLGLSKSKQPNKFDQAPAQEPALVGGTQHQDAAEPVAVGGAGQEVVVGVELLEGLNPEQAQAVMHFEGPAVVTAAAGSGKTHVLTRRVGMLVKRGIDPNNITAISFSRKAREEMMERITHLVPEARGVFVGTFHQLALKIVHGFGWEVGLKQAKTLDEKQSKEIIATLIDDSLRPEAFVAMINYARLHRLDQNGVLSKYPKVGAKLWVVMKQFEAIKKEGNWIDFNDQLFLALEILEKSSAARAWANQRCQWVLVDEFQDTNPLHEELILAMMGNSRNLFVVGDMDQSIYGFNGAAMEGIVTFAERFGATAYHLMTNYRNSGSIAEVANQLIKHNPIRKPHPMRSTKDKGQRPQLHRAMNPFEEATVIAGLVKGELSKGRKAKDIAILLRLNHQARVIEKTFKELGIPFRPAGGVSYFNKEEVRVVLSLLAILGRVATTGDFRRVLGGLLGVNEANLDHLEVSGRLNLEGLQSVKSQKVNLAGFAKWALENEPPKLDTPEAFTTFFYQIIEHPAIKPRLRRYLEERGVGIEGIEEIPMALNEYAQDKPGLGLEEFLVHCGIEQNGEAEDGVVLSTVHSAKGLEWPVVIIPGLVENVFPATTKGQEVEEERRLMYVAITRAKDGLYITLPQNVQKRGVENLSTPSRFLSEVPRENLEVA